MPKGMLVVEMLVRNGEVDHWKEKKLMRLCGRIEERRGNRDAS